MTKRYKATRSFWFQPEDGGPEQLVTEGQEIKGASDGKLEALAADGLIRETRAKTTEEG
jgi:hypothetical protein